MLQILRVLRVQSVVYGMYGRWNMCCMWSLWVVDAVSLVHVVVCVVCVVGVVFYVRCAFVSCAGLLLLGCILYMYGSTRLTPLKGLPAHWHAAAALWSQNAARWHATAAWLETVAIEMRLPTEAEMQRNLSWTACWLGVASMVCPTVTSCRLMKRPQ